MNSIKSFFIIVFIFLLIFNPPFINGANITAIGVVISGIICLFHLSKIHTFLKNKQIRKILFAFLCFIAYAIFIAGFNYYLIEDKTILESLIQTIRYHASILIVSFAIIIVADKNKVSFKRLSRYYAMAGLCQAFIGLSCLISPSIRQFFITLILKNSNIDRFVMLVELSGTVRNYGFAYMLYDMFGMTMAILAVLAFMEGMKGKRIYYLISVLIAIVAVVNARSSFILIIAGLILLTLTPRDSAIALSWLIKRVINFFLISIAILFLFSNILLGTSEQALWLSQGIYETAAFIQGDNIGYYDALFNKFIFLPHDIFTILFGTGLDPVDAVGRGSDVGYVKYIWYYGIVGSFIYYRLYFILFKSAYKKLLWPYNACIKAIAIMVAIYLIKLTCLGYSMAAVVFMPLCLYATYIGMNTYRPKEIGSA